MLFLCHLFNTEMAFLVCSAYKIRLNIFEGAITMSINSLQKYCLTSAFSKDYYHFEIGHHWLLKLRVNSNSDSFGWIDIEFITICIWCFHFPTLGVPAMSQILTGDSQKLSFSTMTKVPFLDFLVRQTLLMCKICPAYLL